MSVKAAATEVLKKAQSPLHAKAIAEQIIAAGLWTSDGKTPEATVSASLYSDIKKNGDKSTFVKVVPQTFRELNNDPLTDLLMHDTRALVKIIELFNRVHELETTLTDEQLRAIILRTDSWLMYILQISSGDFHK
jgi:hypothetical protein